MEINVLLPQVTPALYWIEPAANSSLKFPATLRAGLANSQNIKKIDFYFIGADETTEHYLVTVQSPGSEISLAWKNKPSSGNYTVYGNIFTPSGKKYQTERLKIIVE